MGFETRPRPAASTKQRSLPLGLIIIINHSDGLTKGKVAWKKNREENFCVLNFFGPKKVISKKKSSL